MDIARCNRAVSRGSAVNERMLRKAAVLGSTGPATPWALLGVAATIGLWAVVSSAQWVNPLLLPPPARVIGAIKDIGFDLFWHAAATIGRIVGGYTLGVLLGLVLGTAMQYSRKTYVFWDGIVETARPVPAVALVPFFILVFGFSEFGKILLVTLGVGLIITVATVESIERVPTVVIRWGLVLGLPRRDLFRQIVLPAAIPELRSGFRIALATAISLVIVSEFMGSTYGLGYLISVAKVTLTTPTLFLAIIILGWISWIADRMLRYAFDRKTAWDVRAKGAIR